MTTILGLLAVLVVLFVAAVVATREGPVLAEAVPDAADIGLPEGTLSAQDVATLRFAMAPRGYRMSEVDETLDRVAAELADRDRRIALLEATIEGGEEPQTQDVRQADAADLPLPEAAVVPVPVSDGAVEPVPVRRPPPPASPLQTSPVEPTPFAPAPAALAPETAPVTPAPTDPPPAADPLPPADPPPAADPLPPADPPPAVPDRPDDRPSNP